MSLRVGLIYLFIYLFCLFGLESGTLRDGTILLIMKCDITSQVQILVRKYILISAWVFSVTEIICD